MMTLSPSRLTGSLMKTPFPRQFSGWLVLIVLAMWPAISQARNAQGCKTADHVVNYAARLEQIDEQLLSASTLTSDEATPATRRQPPTLWRSCGRERRPNRDKSSRRNC
jgi:hypothetical protein